MATDPNLTQPNAAQQANATLPPLVSGNTPASNMVGMVGINDAASVPWWKKTPTSEPQFWNDKTAAKNAYPLLPTVVKNEFINTMNKNYGKGNWTQTELLSGYSESVDLAAIGFALNGQEYTPDVYFAELVYNNAANGLDAGGKAIKNKTGSGGPTTSVQKSIRLTDESTARGLVDNALNQYLGRSATSTEQQAFFKALNVQESQNPTITQQTTSSGGGVSSTISKTIGGFSPSTFASEYAAGQEGAGEFQAATSLLDTFINALGAKV